MVAAADLGASLRVVVTGSNTAGSAQAASAQTAAVIAAGQTTVTFSVTAGGDDGDVSVSGPQSGGYPPSGSAAANTTGTLLHRGAAARFRQLSRC